MNPQTPYVYYYGIGLLDDLHNYFPAVLYDSGRFMTVQDLLRYIQLQTQQRFNLFTNATRNYLVAHPPPQPRRTYASVASAADLRPPTRGRVPPSEGLVTETFEFSFPQGVTRAEAGQDREFLQALLGLMAIGQDRMEPVVVRPTDVQISNATSLRMAREGDEGSMCSICQDTVSEGQAVRTITHCSHWFHKDCVDTWFQTNVRCPVCRHDIRGGGPTGTSHS